MVCFCGEAPLDAHDQGQSRSVSNLGDLYAFMNEIKDHEATNEYSETKFIEQIPPKFETPEKRLNCWFSQYNGDGGKQILFQIHKTFKFSIYY